MEAGKTGTWPHLLDVDRHCDVGGPDPATLFRIFHDIYGRSGDHTFIHYCTGAGYYELQRDHQQTCAGRCQARILVAPVGLGGYYFPGALYSFLYWLEIGLDQLVI